MIVKNIFGAVSIRNGFDPANAYTHKMDGGITVTVNAGHWRQSMDAAVSLGDAFAKGGNMEVQGVAYSQLCRANAAEQHFLCTISREILLLPPPEQAPV